MIVGTLCRCGHLLDCCADCRGWLIAESPRIADSWAWWLRTFGDAIPIRRRFAQAAEADNLAHFMAARGGDISR